MKDGASDYSQEDKQYLKKRPEILEDSSEDDVYKFLVLGMHQDLLGLWREWCLTKSGI